MPDIGIDGFAGPDNRFPPAFVRIAAIAGRMRARRWWGVEPGDPEAYLWGAPVELNKTDWVKTLRDRLINQLVLNAFAMSSARMDGYLDALEAFEPRCLYGYASSVALLDAHAQERGRRPRLPRLKVVCTTGEPLFTSNEKYDSACGWPSFTRPIVPEVTTYHTDTRYGMKRVEVRSRVGDSHLGHVFDDGPKDRGGKRYCINSAAIRFVPVDKLAAGGYAQYRPLFGEK